MSTNHCEPVEFYFTEQKCLFYALESLGLGKLVVMTLLAVPLAPMTQAPTNDGHGRPASAAAQPGGAAGPERRSLSQWGRDKGLTVSVPVPNNALGEGLRGRGASSGVQEGRRLAGVVWKRGQINTAFRRSSSLPCAVCAQHPVCFYKPCFAGPRCHREPALGRRRPGRSAVGFEMQLLGASRDPALPPPKHARFRAQQARSLHAMRECGLLLPLRA
jgi:hypothetical protein